MSRTDQRQDVYQIVTDCIIKNLEEGTVPWQKTYAEAGPPQNLITRRPYKGINTILLSMLNYEQNYFLTFKQLKEIGGSVIKGETSNIVIFWNVKEQENEQREKVKTFLLRYYLVFNIAQCKDIPEKYLPEPVENKNNPIEACENILKYMPDTPKIVHKEKQPFYHRVDDFINMPKMKSFIDSESYYGTLFHELVHSTGHTSRLNRASLMESEAFETELYSVEELVAEIGACFLKSHAGIMREIANNAAYIQSWIDALKGDKRLIFHASSQAQKAVDYILDANPKPEEKAEEEAIEEVMMF